MTARIYFTLNQRSWGIFELSEVGKRNKEARVANYISIIASGNESFCVTEVLRESLQAVRSLGEGYRCTGCGH